MISVQKNSINSIATWLCRSFRQLRVNKLGVVAVEFALIAPLLIALTLGGIQVGIIYFADTELSRVTQKAAREVMVGGAHGLTAAKFQAALCANISVIFSCGNLLIGLSPQASLGAIVTTAPVITYDANGNITNAFPYNPGSPGQIMVLQVVYPLPVVSGPLFNFATANGQTILISTIVFANEPS